jgi:succinate dehydrogenase hydrophobic anchor subunit
MERTIMDRSDPRQRAARPGAAGALWLVQALSGLLLVVLLGLHMIAHHFVVEGGLRNFAEVIDYMSNPTIFFLEVLFLLVVTPHALLGLRAIILDLNPGARAQRAADWALAIVGGVAIVYGIWLAVAIQRL